MKALRLTGMLLLVAACAKPVPDEYYTPEEETAPVAFSLSGDLERESKITGSTDVGERTVVRWAVFVFDDEDGQYVYRTSENGNGLTVKLRVGRNYKAYAMVNYPLTGSGALVPASVRTADDLVNKVASLSDQKAGELMMYGSLPFYLNAGAAQVLQEKSIAVTRLVSRLDVKGISTDFSEKPQLAAKIFTLRHIYVTNVYRTSRCSSDYLPGELSSQRMAWYNTMGWHRGEPAQESLDALLGQRNIDAVITPSSPYTAPVSFYAFPNATPVSEDTHDTGSWRNRCTRIVLEATLDDDTYYYQITAPAMRRNYIYEAVDIVIRGLGSRDPEERIIDPDALDVHFSISRMGWTENYEIEENS